MFSLCFAGLAGTVNTPYIHTCFIMFIFLLAKKIRITVYLLWTYKKAICIPEDRNGPDFRTTKFRSGYRITVTAGTRISGLSIQQCIVPNPPRRKGGFALKFVNSQPVKTSCPPAAGGDKKGLKQQEKVTQNHPNQSYRTQRKERNVWRNENIYLQEFWSSNVQILTNLPF